MAPPRRTADPAGVGTFWWATGGHAHTLPVMRRTPLEMQTSPSWGGAGGERQRGSGDTERRAGHATWQVRARESAARAPAACRREVDWAGRGVAVAAEGRTQLAGRAGELTGLAGGIRLRGFDLGQRLVQDDHLRGCHVWDHLEVAVATSTTRPITIGPHAPSGQPAPGELSGRPGWPSSPRPCSGVAGHPAVDDLLDLGRTARPGPGCG